MEELCVYVRKPKDSWDALCKQGRRLMLAFGAITSAPRPMQRPIALGLASTNRYSARRVYSPRKLHLYLVLEINNLPANQNFRSAPLILARRQCPDGAVALRLSGWGEHEGQPTYVSHLNQKIGLCFPDPSSFIPSIVVAKEHPQHLTLMAVFPSRLLIRMIPQSSRCWNL